MGRLRPHLKGRKRSSFGHPTCPISRVFEVLRSAWSCFAKVDADAALGLAILANYLAPGD